MQKPEYFSIFEYNWLAGNEKTALREPFNVVLAKSKAQKYFGNIPLTNIIGKELIYNDSLHVKVSGVVEDWEKNTDLAFTDFISYSTVNNSFLKQIIHDDDWNDMSTWAFVKLSPGIKPVQIYKQIATLLKKRNAHNTNENLTFKLESLTNMHFNNEIIENPIRTADLPAMYGLIGIALFILILAVINFINLSTAQSIQRAKEIGIRKVMGSNSMKIMLQFFTEAFFNILVAVLIAIIFVEPALKIFYSFVPKGITFKPLDISTILFITLIVIVTTLFSGFYPARVLSSYLPVESLKGAGTQKMKEKWLIRKSLIVFNLLYL